MGKLCRWFMTNLGILPDGENLALIWATRGDFQSPFPLRIFLKGWGRSGSRWERFRASVLSVFVQTPQSVSVGFLLAWVGRCLPCPFSSPKISNFPFSVILSF
jgi:hypothetical protein